MKAGRSGAAFEALARDIAIRADGIPDRLSMVARLRYGLKRLYEPILDGLPDRFRYLLMLLDRTPKIESNFFLSRHLGGLEMEIVEHCCLFNPPDNERAVIQLGLFADSTLWRRSSVALAKMGLEASRSVAAHATLAAERAHAEDEKPGFSAAVIRSDFLFRLRGPPSPYLHVLR